MKKVTFLLLLLVCSFQAMAQVLNQPANWPNTNWTITGTYDPDPANFVADPTLTANFAYDDDEAGSGSDNDIAAESPIIDLTPAFNAGETWLFFDAMYVFNNIGSDNITIQYWNANTSTWNNWVAPIVTDTPGAPLENFCAGTTAPLNSGELNIAGFTATQLSGFRYRIKYDDGDSWAWGFCFNSPTLMSQVPPACSIITGLSLGTITATTAEISWNPGTDETAWEVAVQPAGTGIPTGNGVSTTLNSPYTAMGLNPSSSYEVYVRADCGVDGFSDWVGPINFLTECTSFTAPYTQGFENAGAIPICWSMSGGEVWRFSDTGGFDHIGNNGVITGTTATNGYFAWVDASGSDAPATLFSPFVDVSGLTNPSLSFYEISDNEGDANSTLTVDVWDGAAWNNVGIYNTNTAGWELKIIDLSALTITGDVQARFVFSETVSGDFTDDIAIDDVTFDEAPLCIIPSGLAVANITGTSADISWNAGTATAWEYVIQPAGTGVPSGNGTPLTVTTVNETGLTFSTAYEVYIRTDCGVDGYSDWVGPLNFTTTIQTNFTVDCTAGPLNVSYCYENDIADDPSVATFTYTSSTGIPVKLTFNSGLIESCCDELVVLDTDGSELYNSVVPGGNLAGLTFQSTGDTLSFYINSDLSISCSSGAFPDGIDYTVVCATCVNPTATYTPIDDCANGQQFLIDVNITSLGDAASVTVTDNQGSPGVQVSTTGVVQMGPYPFATPVIITVSNDDDVNCVINSAPIQLLACPPANDNCDGAIVAVVNAGSTCDATTPGTVLAATPSGVPSGSCTGNPDDDVWFQFTALNEAQLISLINITGGSTNLDHAVYTGSCGSLTELYCSPDNSSYTPPLTVGATYFIRVFSGGSVPETSTFDLCIQQAPTNTTCETAANFCSQGEGSSVTGFPSVGSVACLGTTPNPSWNIIQIGESGLVEIEIAQTSLATGQGIDVDFVLWGPFDTTTDYCSLGLEVDCPSCPNNTTNPNFYPFGNIVDCSYDAASVENLTIPNAQSGEIYLLLVTNYANQQGQITITQTNTGGGTTVAGIQVNLGGDQAFCGTSSVVLTANSPFADTYEWYANGLQIVGEDGPTLTVTESNTYTVIVTDTQCDATAQDTVTITLGLAPVANPVADIVTCDDISGDGVEPFNLEAQTPFVLGAQDPTLFNVTYHLSFLDAVTNTGALSSPYTNVSNPQTIYVRIEDANAPNCIDVTNFDLVVSGAIPTATSVNMEACDDLSGDGVEAFDLTLNDVNILGGQSPTDYTVSYYATVADADAQTSPLLSPYTNTTNPQTIYARVDNNAAVDCYAVAAFDLIVNPPPTVNAAPDLAGCDTDDNSIAEYDLTGNESTIIGAQTDLTLTYYTTMADAMAETGSIGTPTNYETMLTTIYVRVVNNVTGCFNVTSFNLVAGELPMTTFATDIDYEVCPNATVPIIITATPQNYTAADVSIVWYQDGGVISGQNGLTLPVLTQGYYEIEVTFNATGCKDVVGQQVVELANCIIPQGISPGVSPGQNDTFDLSSFNVKRIEIFNRLGTLVYSKDNYTDEWHGQSNSGDELPVGTYFYTMIYEGGAKQLSAWVYINK